MRGSHLHVPSDSRLTSYRFSFVYRTRWSVEVCWGNAFRDMSNVPQHSCVLGGTVVCVWFIQLPSSRILKVSSYCILHRIMLHVSLFFFLCPSLSVIACALFWAIKGSFQYDPVFLCGFNVRTLNALIITSNWLFFFLDYLASIVIVCGRSQYSSAGRMVRHWRMPLFFVVNEGDTTAGPVISAAAFKASSTLTSLYDS